VSDARGLSAFDSGRVPLSAASGRGVTKRNKIAAARMTANANATALRSSVSSALGGWLGDRRGVPVAIALVRGRGRGLLLCCCRSRAGQEHSNG